MRRKTSYCVSVRGGGRGGEGQRKACSVGRRRKESCLSGKKCVNASLPVSRMIIIAQFDWLADRRARRLLVVIWASGLRPLQLFLVCVCVSNTSNPSCVLFRSMSKPWFFSARALERDWRPGLFAIQTHLNRKRDTEVNTFISLAMLHCWLRPCKCSECVGSSFALGSGYRLIARALTCCSPAEPPLFWCSRGAEWWCWQSCTRPFWR